VSPAPTTTRERILGEATRQLLDKGYAAFTVAAVRDALGLSSGSMFHAFASKASLAAAVYVDGMVDYQRVAQHALAGGAGPERSLRRLIDAHLGWVEDHPALARYLFSTLPDDVAAEADASLAQHNAEFFAGLGRFYDRLVPGAEPATHPFPVAHVLALGPAQEYCRQWVRGHVDVPPREVSALLQEVALAAVRTAAHGP
jgi:AcrR family transcriptional regulator